MSARLRLALAAAVAAALGAAAAPVPGARADTIADAVTAFQDYLKTNPDSQGIRNQIGELSQKKDPRIADALLPLLNSPKYDEDVKIEVCRNAGKQGKPAVAGVLMSYADSKPLEEKPKLIAAALEGVGDANAKAFYEDLMKIAKKYLDSNADVACAGYRAAANHVTRQTVDDLIKELTRSETSEKKDSAVKKAARAAARPEIIAILKKITGERISDSQTWREWWKEREKTWKPPVAGDEKGKDLNASEVFKDDAYAFEVRKPNKAWAFRRPDTGPYLLMEALDEGQRAAWCEVFVEGTKGMKLQTPEAYAKELKNNLEGKFRDIKEAEWDKKCTYGGVKGIEQLVKGMHKDFDAVQMHNIYVEKGGVMYYFICFWKSGKPASMKDDIEEILKSFKITR